MKRGEHYPVPTLAVKPTSVTDLCRTCHTYHVTDNCGLYNPTRLCIIVDCYNWEIVRRLCSTHYDQARHRKALRRFPTWKELTG
jgi:hypothetical protein